MAKTKTVNSRLAKAESKRMMKQTALFLVASVVLLLVFLFIILPGLIRFISSGGDVNQIVQTDTIPPQTPIISAPVPATYSAQINIEGYGEVDSEIVLVLNSSEADRKVIDSEDGSFDFEVGLQDGENVITTYAIDEAGNESSVSKEYKVVFDNVPPQIGLETPEDGQQFELRKNQNITIKGTTEPRSTVYINGRRNYANSEGVFSTSYQLSEGDNNILIKIEDPAGNSAEKEIVVKFRY